MASPSPQALYVLSHCRSVTPAQWTFQLIKAALPGMKIGSDGGHRSIGLASSMVSQMDVHGFTACSATKFAPRGLAEALQQEVIIGNIHVSLIFPPTVETPGLFEEAKEEKEADSLYTASSSGNLRVAASLDHIQ